MYILLMSILGEKEKKEKVNMKFVRITSLIIGLLMISQWIFFLTTGNVPELETARVSITFHIVIELITALMLMSIFFILKKNKRRFLFMAAYIQGMLGYTVVNSSGYFVQSGDFIFLLMFIILLAVSVINLAIIIKLTDLQENK